MKKIKISIVISLTEIEIYNEQEEEKKMQNLLREFEN